MIFVPVPAPASTVAAKPITLNTKEELTILFTEICLVIIALGLQRRMGKVGTPERLFMPLKGHGDVMGEYLW